MKSCLIVIDMQNDFIYGSLGTDEAKKIVPFVKERVQQAVDSDEEIIFTKDTHFEDYLDTQEGKKLPIKHCIVDTWGYEICDELLPFTKNTLNIINKNTFGYKDLPLYIAEYDKLTLIGLCTDICVISNAILLKSFYPEKIIVIEEKCCAGTTVENHNNAIKAMRCCQFDII